MPDGSWRLRPGEPADADACAAIAVAAWERIHAAYRDLLGDVLHDRLMPEWQAVKAEQVGRALRERPADTFVAVAGDAGETVAGFVTFHLDCARQIGQIGNNAVAPGWQSRGIAQALYRAALDRMREAGMTLAMVATGLDEGHAPARAAYAKVGFRVGTPSVTYYMELGADASAGGPYASPSGNRRGGPSAAALPPSPTTSE